MTGLEVAAEIAALRSADARGHSHDVRARRLPASRARRGRERLSLEGQSGRRAANAVRRVHSGGRAIDPELAREAWTEHDPLNDRERQVLRLAGEGKTGAEIAAALNSDGGDRAQLSVGGGEQSRRQEPYRCGADRSGQGLAVADRRFGSRAVSVRSG